MSSADTGRKRENRIVVMLGKLGYFPIRRPGSRGEYDIYATNMSGCPPHLSVQAGGTSKSIARAFEKLRQRQYPAGTILLLGRWISRKQDWRWHGDIYTRYSSAEAAIEAAKKALS